MAERNDEAQREDKPHRGGNGAARPPSARELVEQGERIGQELASLASSARHAAEGWEDVLRERIEQQPYAALAIAAGVGYVLGGGVPTGLFRIAIALSGRALIDSLVAQVTPGGGRRGGRR
jgi:ElaB/YqjD/DUF883 family membrane-anchored ribosome-binding protein